MFQAVKGQLPLLDIRQGVLGVDRNVVDEAVVEEREAGHDARITGEVAYSFKGDRSS